MRLDEARGLVLQALRQNSWGESNLNSHYGSRKSKG